MVSGYSWTASLLMAKKRILHGKKNNNVRSKCYAFYFYNNRIDLANNTTLYLN